MWCSAATLTRTTQGRVGRRHRLVDDPVEAERPDPRRPLEDRAEPGPADATRTAALLRGLDRHRGLVGAGHEPGDDRGERLLGDVAVAGRPVEELVLGGGGRSSTSPGSSRTRRSMPSGAGRSVRDSSSTRSASGRSAGSLARSTAHRGRRRRVVLEARRVPQPVVVLRPSSSPSRNSASPSRRKVRPLRHGSHSDSDRNGVEAAAWQAARVAPSRMPTAETSGTPRSRRYCRAASTLASQEAHPVGVVLEPRGVAGAVVVEAQGDEAPSASSSASRRKVRCAARPSSPIGGQRTAPPRARPPAGVDTQP